MKHGRQNWGPTPSKLQGYGLHLKAWFQETVSQFSKSRKTMIILREVIRVWRESLKG